MDFTDIKLCTSESSTSSDCLGDPRRFFKHEDVRANHGFVIGALQAVSRPMASLPPNQVLLFALALIRRPSLSVNAEESERCL